ncbi:MAG: DUF5667 domain-containing protein [Candidatus Binatia bacterium]|nr:DUF5667 domain-containing protein [Candidatus Binatia bacterium]
MSLWRGMWLLMVVVWSPGVTSAGHGFLTAFGNIEWLPDPGYTPDSPWYPLDTWQEAGQLLLAPRPEEKIRLCVTFAREKLAELEAMVSAHNSNAAAHAVSRYRAYLEQAGQLLGDDLVDRESSAAFVANALLEQQYILSLIYEDLPVGVRAGVLRVLAVAQEHYTQVAALLSAGKKGALFFKEEEVRWSVQMAMRVDDNKPEIAEETLP